MAKTTKKTTASVEDKLKALHQLQVIDTKVDKIRIIRGELPLEIVDLADLIAGLNTRLEKFDAELVAITNDIAANKNTIALATDAIEKYEKQLKNIKNNREFTSLTKEVEYQNLEIQIAEKKKIQNDADVLHKTVIINAWKEQIAEREEELNIKQSELNEIIQETEKEEKALMADSAKAEKVIDDRLLSAYKRIRSKVANGLAVVSVDRNACGGCFSEIPPQRQLDIQMHKKVIACEHCGRIMIDANIFEEQEA
ncbi:C4-type zinc ribbon domain-containing protein [Flavobacteriales bacterium]|nr:C4-type zinc ribbon domain-containing protein [Flavobacteriales bacterium]